MDTLTVTPIEDDDNLLNTIDSHIKLRKLKEVMLLCWTIKLLSILSAGANVREGGNKNCSSLYYSDSNSDTATGKMRIKARARLIERQRLESEAQLRKASEEEELAKTKKEKREKEAREREAGLDGLLDSNDYRSDSSPDINPEDDLEDEEATTAKDLSTTVHPANKQTRMRDSLSARNKRTMKLPARWGGYCDFTLYQLTGAYILYFKELSSDNGRIFASDTFTSRTRRKCEMPEQKGLILRRRTSTSSHNDDWLGRAADAWKNEVVAMDPANSTLCDLSDLLVVRFCIFSDPALENIGIPTNEEVVEMQTDTATALADELAAVNKLVRLQTFTLKILEHANMPAVHSKATKHCLAPSAARFALVCGFGKVDRHVFRADNTMSVEINAILLLGHVTVWGRTVFDEFHNCKSEGTIMAKFYKDL
ncbi:hypothetical protein HBH77_242570 [Parastagonospora nodorum]|nr:hypothetical protein HBH77_242570 [Parastagonospora nodorum]